MFGIQKFGVPLFAKSEVLAEYVPVEDFTFNTYGLQNAGQYGIHIEKYNIETPNRDFATDNVPGGHGMILKEDYFRQNPVTITGWISQPTRIQLENKIHEFLKNIHGQGGKLIIKDGGNFKELETTMQRASFDNQHYSICRKDFTVKFEGIKSFWQDSLYSSNNIFGNTSLSIDGTMNNLGSIEANPIIIVIFSAATDVTALSFENTTNGEKVSISETITSGDVVIFDSEEKTVLLNNNEIEYSGRFPKLQVGLNSFTIDVTGTSATVDVTAKHKNQYLTP